MNEPRSITHAEVQEGQHVAGWLSHVEGERVTGGRWFCGEVERRRGVFSSDTDLWVDSARLKRLTGLVLLPDPPEPDGPTIYPPLTQPQMEQGMDRYAGLVPIQDEDGLYMFWGHPVKSDVVECIKQHSMEMGMMTVEEATVEPGDIRYRWAVTLSEPGDDEWRISWGEEYQGHALAFRVTTCDP